MCEYSYFTFVEIECKISKKACNGKKWHTKIVVCNSKKPKVF